MDCPLVDTVIFTYGFHGRRREVFERVLANLHDRSYRFLPLLLWCSEEENLRRSRLDGRDEARILRGLTLSRQVYGDVEYPRLDMTHLTAEESAEALIWYIDTGNIFGE